MLCKKLAPTWQLKSSHISYPAFRDDGWLGSLLPFLLGRNHGEAIGAEEVPEVLVQAHLLVGRAQHPA